ncbi:hypothetical protein glysoja_025054 [Glycine soja]|uniref:Uncharacterized protein n=1 Tax=Glycine soja TaxID=3848 RepID=A0A0B2QDS6_GLYSO|nr:hypothetical protein glysoja_025054 [Glycine soja]
MFHMPPGFAPSPFPQGKPGKWHPPPSLSLALLLTLHQRTAGETSASGCPPPPPPAMAPRRRWSWQGRRVLLLRQTSSSDTPKTRMKTNRMCLHGVVRSGQVHEGEEDKVTVYTFPVAPNMKKVEPERWAEAVAEGTNYSV